MPQSDSRRQERTDVSTSYTITNADGSPRFRTDSPFVAEAHSRIGLRVTAVTEGAR